MLQVALKCAHDNMLLKVSSINSAINLHLRVKQNCLFQKLTFVRLNI